MRLWRVSEWADLSGIGGTMTDGRWHVKGRPVIYLAGARALAVLEVLVHYEDRDVPPDFQLLEVDAPDDLAADHWPTPIAGTLAETRAWGSQWLTTRRTALASVPSVIVPGDRNWLLNPAHPDAGQVRVVTATRHPWDHRLFR